MRPDGTVTHTIKPARRYRALQQQATVRGIHIEYRRRLVGAEATPGGSVLARFNDGIRAAGDLLVGADGVHSVIRGLIDRRAHRPLRRLVNFGGYTPDSAGTAEPEVWQMIFGRRAFFGYVVDPARGTVWFANVPRPAVTAAERAATTSGQRQLMDLFTADRGPAAELIGAGTLELAGDSTHDLPRVPIWHKSPMIVIGDAAHAPHLR